MRGILAKPQVMAKPQVQDLDPHKPGRERVCWASTSSDERVTHNAQVEHALCTEGGLAMFVILLPLGDPSNRKRRNSCSTHRLAGLRYQNAFVHLAICKQGIVLVRLNDFVPEF